jgi:hypothetical protein
MRQINRCGFPLCGKFTLPFFSLSLQKQACPACFCALVAVISGFLDITATYTRAIIIKIMARLILSKNPEKPAIWRRMRQC